MLAATDHRGLPTFPIGSRTSRISSSAVSRERPPRNTFLVVGWAEWLLSSRGMALLASTSRPSVCVCVQTRERERDKTESTQDRPYIHVHNT